MQRVKGNCGGFASKYLPDFCNRQLCVFADVQRIGFITIFCNKHPNDFLYFSLFHIGIRRYADDPRCINKSPRNPLTNPPYRISRQTAPSWVERFQGSHETNNSFLNKVEQRKTMILISFCNRNHKAHIVIDKKFTRLFVTLAHAMDKRRYFFRRKNRIIRFNQLDKKSD